MQDGLNWIEQEGGDRLSVYSDNLEHSGRYQIKTTFHITDYETAWPVVGTPAGVDTYEEVKPIDEWTLEMVYPCGDDTTLQTTFDEMYLYAVIGNGAATYDFVNYSDTTSVTIDALYGFEPAGYVACGSRLFEVAEITYQTPANDTI